MSWKNANKINILIVVLFFCINCICAGGEESIDSHSMSVQTLAAASRLGVSASLTSSTKFKIGSEPKQPVADSISTKTSSLAAAVLTKCGLRGKVRRLGLDKVNPADKQKIGEIKDEADGIAKKIYEAIVKIAGVVLRVRASEGFGRDDVAESFKANDVVGPDVITGKEPVHDAIIDVIEGTNAFVSDVEGKSLAELEPWKAGATSVIVTGLGVGSLGNCPDIYVDSIVTLVPPEHREMMSNLLDPEITTEEPLLTEEQRQKYGDILEKAQEERIEWFLSQLADVNGITIGDLEVVLMDRSRETQRLAALRKIKKKYPGLEITTIKDGTVIHALSATFGRKQGKHKVIMTVGAAPEGFMNLAVAGVFRDQGALASVRVYSENVNTAVSGEKAVDLDQRYAFSEEETEGENGIRHLRPADCEEIIAGRKLFTQNDVQGEGEGSFAFISHNGVFGVEGARELADGRYQVTILRVTRIAGEPCVWFEEKVFSPEELALFMPAEQSVSLEVGRAL